MDNTQSRPVSVTIASSRARPEAREFLAFKNTYPEAVKEKVLANFARWGLQR